MKRHDFVEKLSTLRERRMYASASIDPEMWEVYLTYHGRTVGEISILEERL